ncbi:MAG: hypothetical protein LAT84_11045 [Balneolia bacterium]|nr:hypothetical protein [Balneolia bacterium]
MKDERTSYKSELLAGGIVIIWHIILIMMFSYSGPGIILPVFYGLLFTAAAIWLSLYFNGKKHATAGKTLAIFSIVYLQLITMPSDEYESRPADEFRSAISILGNFRAVSPEMLITIHESPYAPVTAALHKYRDELPEYSWLISFEGSGEEVSPYLFNIRNNTAAYNHPGVRHAELTNEHLLVEIEKSNATVTYAIPLDEPPPAFTINGEPNLPSPSGTFRATVYPHMLSVDDHNRFQQLFYRLLTRIYS